MGNFCCNERDSEFVDICPKLFNTNKICTSCHVERVTNKGDKFCYSCFLLEDEKEYEYKIPSFIP